ncbi:MULTISPECIES: c-type cytochrome [Hyphomicrobiales]|jgi:hypothetical protein|uniref:c-type cytochrome n=1 Tax=Hyphomicrobiales TaxID=356 RepID=UPI000371B6B8|nr:MULTISPECIES: c-type cytochrome [Phyllobacteriaceae]MCX8568112.1 cytochrome c [Aminobacter sp. MET-1]
MKRLITVAVLVSGSLISLHAQEMSYGKTEFLNSCAACHGSGGKGDGPLAAELRRVPTDLTLLAEKNGGEFPYRRVLATIDGRYVVPGHGERDMPVWGQQFLLSDKRIYGPDDGPVVTQARIHELATFIESLQSSRNEGAVP